MLVLCVSPTHDLGWSAVCDCACTDQERGQGVQTPLVKKTHKNIGFLCNTGPDPQKNHKATCTNPAFNVGQLSERQRNAIEIAFR